MIMIWFRAFGVMIRFRVLGFRVSGFGVLGAMIRFRAPYLPAPEARACAQGFGGSAAVEGSGFTGLGF